MAFPRDFRAREPQTYAASIRNPKRVIVIFIVSLDMGRWKVKKDDKDKKTKAKYRMWSQLFRILAVTLLVVSSGCYFIYPGSVKTQEEKNDVQQVQVKNEQQDQTSHQHAVEVQEPEKLQRRAVDAQEPEEIQQGSVDEQPPHHAQNKGQSVQQLTAVYDTLVEEVRAIKRTGVIMEIDPKSLEATARLQKAARELCRAKYGDYSKPYHIQVEVEFQGKGRDRHGKFVIETAPLDLIPYSVFNFLEVVRGYQTGGFHRKAPHVLQVTVTSQFAQQSLAFQEYSKHYPHKIGTVGYCGRPSGGHGCWYISTLDNTRNHGPGSQQKKNPYEADANFGRVLPDDYRTIEPRIRKAMEGKMEGFLSNQKDWVLITGMHILVPGGDGGEYIKWRES